MGQGWEHNGIGMVAQWDRDVSTVGQGWEHNGTGMGAQWDMDGNTMGPGYDHNGARDVIRMGSKM